MTELQRYLAEEVAEDHADGIITRREAMRRLGLLGLGAVSASTLLAACGSTATADSTGAAATAAAAGRAAQSDAGVETWAPVTTQAIQFTGPRGTLLGDFAAAKRPRGSVLVMHENRGLTDHIRQVAGRFAADGFSALALDLLSEEGGTAKVGDEAQVAAALSQIDSRRFDADMKAGVSELRRRVRGPAAQAAMKKAGLRNHVMVFGGADHAFFQ